MNAPNLTPDPAPANAFLDALDPRGIFTFQTFPEGESQSESHYPTILHGTLKEHSARLAELNSAGHGVFVMVNEGDLKGRAARNVVRVRAHYVDLDGAPLEPLVDAELPPHIVVESSPGRWHGYWRVENCPITEFKARQHALAARFNGDKSVCDLPRVMRLPGFWHLKSATPFQTRLIKPAYEGQTT